MSIQAKKKKEMAKKRREKPTIAGVVPRYGGYHSFC
jgi:hypothetical protein